MQISWKKVSSTDAADASNIKYRVEYDSGNGKWVEAKDAVVEKEDSNHMTISKLEAGTNYRVRVVAVNAYGDECASANLDVTTVGVPRPPETPSIRWALPESVMLFWRNNSNDNSNKHTDLTQNLEMSKGNSNNFAKVSTVAIKEIKGSGYEALVTSLQPGENYFFRVIASNKQGPSPPSRVIPVKTPDGLPSKPSSFKYSEPTPTSLKISWICPPTRQKWPLAPKQKEEPRTFLVEYDDSNKPGKSSTWKSASGAPTELNSVFTYALNGLQPGTQIAIRVTASNRFGSGATSKVIMATTIGPPLKPSKPAIVQKTPTSLYLK